jgi:hypothetical protein
MINAAIIEFVEELDKIISGELNFDGVNVATDNTVVEHLSELRRHLLDFQAAWKRMFLRNHVHIFLAYFRVFGNGDMTVVPKPSRKGTKLFTNYFSWDTMGLWYLVICFVIINFFLTLFISDNLYFFYQLVWIFTRPAADRRFPRLGITSSIKPTMFFEKLQSESFKRFYPPIDTW